MNEEVNDLIQIGSLIFRIGRGITMAAIKVLTLAYYAKWHGQTSFQRLHNVCGSHIGYLEIDTQDPKILKETINNTLEKYHVLYSALPDLNLDDNRIQLAYNADQAESVKAALNYYNSLKLEKLKNLKDKYGVDTQEYLIHKQKLEAEMPAIRSVTAEDYAASRLDIQGKETEEYQKLEASAKEAIRKEEDKKKSGDDEMSLEEKKEKMAGMQKESSRQELLRTGKAMRVRLGTEPEIEQINNGKTFTEMYRVRLEDGEHSLLLAEDQMLDPKTALIGPEKEYRLISNVSGKISHVKGAEIKSLLKKEVSVTEGIKQGMEHLQNIRKTRGVAR